MSLDYKQRTPELFILRVVSVESEYLKRHEVLKDLSMVIRPKKDFIQFGTVYFSVGNGQTRSRRIR